jgi:hypothetical protein
MPFTNQDVVQGQVVPPGQENSLLDDAPVGHGKEKVDENTSAKLVSSQVMVIMMMILKYPHSH